MTRPAAPAGARGPADLAALTAALREVSGEDDAVIGGALLASADGLLLAAEARGAQVDTVSAMSAITVGIVAQLLEQAGVGETKACLFEGSSGHVAVFPLKGDVVLVVISQKEVTMGLFSLAARGALSRIRAAMGEPTAT